ncbi:MAG: tetratricopeptide repeat protein, partial [Nannocystaceae bacterium]
PRPEMNDPSLRLVLALLALERGETAQAAAHANWLAEHARGARIAASTCRVLVRLGEARRAATFAQQRINEGIASPSLHLELALAWEAMGQDDASYRALEDGLTAFPDDPALLETAAARADAAGNVDRAIELYTRAISHHSAPALMHEAIARVATDAGRLDIAIQHARAAVTLAGDQDPKVYRILYDALLASGDTDGARAALERGRRRFPQAPILGVP